jgi:hydroxymethylglutaryl-CoA lyase
VHARNTRCFTLDLHSPPGQALLLDLVAMTATRRSTMPSPDDLGLPARVEIREVGLRDGLPIEKPIPTSARPELLGELVAAGGRRVEVTGFVSPRAVPARADAELMAAALDPFPGFPFSALVASPRGAVRALDAGLRDLEYVVSASDEHSRANVGRTISEAPDHR